MAKDYSSMRATQLWDEAAKAMRENRLRDAKAALDEIGLRFDEIYSRLEERIQDLGTDTNSRALS